MAVVAIILVLAVFFAFWLFFNRDPERSPPKGNVIVSPADGKVIAVIDAKKSILTDGVPKAAKLISIFLSPFDVHVQRAPLDGKVILVKFIPGPKRSAWNLAALSNARNEILFNTKIGKVKVVQLAGLLASRLRCFVHPGQKVKKGDRIGRILFGSNVCLILPKVKVAVKKGDQVRAGETILAQY